MTLTRAVWKSSTSAALPIKPTGRRRALLCSIASGWNWRGRWRPIPRVLLLDEVAGGLTEHECHALVALINGLRFSAGVSIIWIEHVVHALLASIDRLLVLHNGSFIAGGDPQTVIRSPQVAEIYMGIEADAESL
jgi:energy-coupling factor transporter ATP-binding protein EcfA2